MGWLTKFRAKGEGADIVTELELFVVRKALVQAFLNERHYDGVLLSRVDNFAMATGGKRNYVNLMSEGGVCSLFIHREGRAWFIGNTIEAPRILDEELAGFGCESRTFPWFEDTPGALVQREFRGRIVSDDGSVGPNVHAELAYLRSLLTEMELEKYRRLGALAAEAMTVTLEQIEPGMAEAEIAALLAAEGAARHCLVPVNLIAADERIARYRHPLPTEHSLLPGGRPEKQVERYVMVVGCFQREGLVASLTRFKRVRELPAGVHDAYRRICGVDTLIQEATTAGGNLGDVFQACIDAYRTLGFPENEWHNHHQGGATGYGARTCKGTPGETFPVGDTGSSRKVKDLCGIDAAFGQAYAWNPSARGVKSEDTFLLLPDGRKEIVTLTPALPRVDLAAVLGRETDVVKSGMAG